MADRIVGFDPDRPRMGLPPVVEDRIVGHFSPNFVPKIKTNLFDIENTTLGTIAPNGDLVAHASNLTSDFIPVVGGRNYVSHHFRVSRIVWFTAEKTVIAGTNTDWLDSGVTHPWVAPDNAAFVRITMAVTSDDTNITPIQFSQGTELGTGEAINTGWWDDKELPPLPAGGDAPEVDMAAVTALIQAEVDKAVPHFEPSFPTLNFTSIFEGWEEPYWLSSDGEVIYGRRGSTLLQSFDEWDTRQDVHTFTDVGTIQGIRSLDDGELLVSTSYDTSVPRKSKLFRSSGYDRANPTVATWTEVLEALSTEANITNSWGMSVYQNVVVASEYGLWGETGARHVWLSEDYGQTFTLVFDFKTDIPAGGPEWGTNAHVHTAAWDPYWSRIWIVCGDRPSSSTYYSDDKGATWTYVEGSGHGGDSVQYTGILALPDTVIFGSDAPPNGVYAYRRGQKSDMPVIEPLVLVDDNPLISRVFHMPFKRDWHPATPAYFAATPANDRGPSVVVGTVDGKKGHVMWEGAQPGSGLPLSGFTRAALGPTAQGNIVMGMTADPTVTGTRVLKAPAPTWERA